MANAIDYMLRGNTASAEKALDRVGSRVSRLAGGAVRLAGAFGLAFGTAGLVMGARNALDTADQMEKLERRLGITTEALSELKFAGEQSGVGFQTLTMGLQRMTRRVAEAAAGTGEARTALLELGIDAQKLARLRPEQQFELIAQSMSEVETSSDRTRLAMKLFDSEGVALLQTMTDGAQGIRTLRGEARALGLTLSHEDAVAAAEANDAMNRLKGSMNVLSREMAINLAPGLTDIANGMAENLPAAVAIAQSAFHRLRSNLFDLMSTGANVAKTFAEFDESLYTFLGDDARAAEARERAATMEAFAKRLMTRSKDASKEANEAIAQHFEQSARTIRDIHAPAVDEVRSKYGKLTFAQAQLAIAAENAAAKAEALGDTGFVEKLTSGIKVFGDTTTSVFGQIENSFRQTVANMLDTWIQSQLQTGLMSLLGFIGIPGLGAAGSAATAAAAIPTAATGNNIIDSFYGFASGGSFTVGRGMRSAGGGDRRLVQFAATDGEQVNIIPAGERFRKGQGGSGDVFIENHFDFTGAGGLQAGEVASMVEVAMERTREKIRNDMSRGRF